MSTISSLEVRLNDFLVGYLTHYPDGKMVFVVDEAYIDYGKQRPILSLSLARPNDEEITRALLADDRHKSASVKAPPFSRICCRKGDCEKASLSGSRFTRIVSSCCSRHSVRICPGPSS